MDLNFNKQNYLEIGNAAVNGGYWQLKFEYLKLHVLQTYLSST